MKRGTPNHPKTTSLAAALDFPRWGAIGILESLWHFCQAYARRGDVGRFSDRAISDSIEWRGDPSVLIRALVDTGWLDECPCHRLRVHDWPEHADAGVTNTSEVKSVGFLECYSDVVFTSSNDSRNDSKNDSMNHTYKATATAMATAEATATEDGNGKKAEPESEEPKPDTLSDYMRCYNAVYDRRVAAVQTLRPKLKARLGSGIHPWQIVALPVLVKAQQPEKDPSPEVLLRDGKHPRTTQRYGTVGGYDWLEQAYLRCDRTTLSPRLVEIAQQFGVLDKLRAMGVAIT